MASFDLLAEPWIPAVNPGGGLREYGLLELLAQAHELMELTDPAPPVQLGLYRFLVAFISDAFELKEEWQLEELLQVGCFDGGKVDAYLTRVGRERFDLFQADHPFMQPLVNSDLPGEPINKLFQHLPSGTFTTLFCHLDPSVQAFAPEVCARGLLTISPFMTKGGAGYAPGINGAPPWYVLVKGRNLFETIVLNCCILPIPGLDGDEPPAWRTKHPIRPRQEANCTSLLEGLTWQPRQVRLIPGPGGVCTYSGRHAGILVRDMQFSYGPMFRGEWMDPQVAYQVDDKGRKPVRPQEGRDIWRDLGPLALLNRDDYENERFKVRYQRPLVVEQYMMLRDHRILAGERPWLDLEVYCLRTKDMKILEWQFDRLSLPDQVTKIPGAGAKVQTGLEQAETAAYYLGKAFKIAYPSEGKRNDKAFIRLSESAQDEFWSGLRLRFWTEFLLRLPELDAADPEAFPALLTEWRRSLRRYGREVLDRYLDGLDADAEELRRQVAARDFYEANLYKVFFHVNPGMGEAKKEKRRRVS